MTKTSNQKPLKPNKKNSLFCHEELDIANLKVKKLVIKKTRNKRLIIETEMDETQKKELQKELQKQPEEEVKAKAQENRSQAERKISSLKLQAQEEVSFYQEFCCNDDSNPLNTKEHFKKKLMKREKKKPNDNKVGFMLPIVNNCLKRVEDHSKKFIKKQSQKKPEEERKAKAQENRSQAECKISSLKLQAQEEVEKKEEQYQHFYLTVDEIEGEDIFKNISHHIVMRCGKKNKEIQIIIKAEEKLLQSLKKKPQKEQKCEVEAKTLEFLKKNTQRVESLFYSNEPVIIRIILKANNDDSYIDVYRYHDSREDMRRMLAPYNLTFSPPQVVGHTNDHIKHYIKDDMRRMLAPYNLTFSPPQVVEDTDDESVEDQAEIIGEHHTYH